MIIEVARFSQAWPTYDDELDRYEITRVMGPDEYHDGYPGSDVPGLDNNTTERDDRLGRLPGARDFMTSPQSPRGSCGINSA